MASLSCLGLLEPGQFGSDSGTVIVASADVGFPITIYGRAVAFGVSYGFAKRRGVTRYLARGYGASWGFAAKPTSATGDADDFFVILY